LRDVRRTGDMPRQILTKCQKQAFHLVISHDLYS
jgi:hypothetical protein